MSSSEQQMAYRVKRANHGACQFCGLLYAKDYKPDQLYHRAYHEKIARVVYPKPLKYFMSSVPGTRDPELVTGASPIWMHKQMYGRARVFQKEFGYDFAQWNDGWDDDLNPHGFLMRGTTKRGENCIVGACAFREYTPGVWTLTWVWICPESRHTGVLSSRWQDFLRRFGNFQIDAPLSTAMKKFILKHGTEAQKSVFGAYLTRPDTED